MMQPLISWLGFEKLMSKEYKAKEDVRYMFEYLKLGVFKQLDLRPKISSFLSD